MSQRWLGLCLTSLCVAGVGCDGREITVFDVPTKVIEGGSAGNMTGNDAGTGAPVGGAGSSALVEGGSAGASAGAPVSGGGAGAAPIDGGAGGSAGTPSGKPCRSKLDCAPGWRCEKMGCDAEIGVCEPLPVIECESEPAPVCGCDGVTYWNDCIRRLFVEAQVDAIGECRATACTCEIGSDCDVPYASCSHLLSNGDMCGHGMGACWVLPPRCKPAPEGSKQWRQCIGPGLPPGPCVDTCEAIATERTHVPAHRDDTCQ
jgi:hypothetical protein